MGSSDLPTTVSQTAIARSGDRGSGKRRAIAALFALLPLSASLADTEGAFCIGPDYLAFEFTYDKEPDGHHLYLMRFANPSAWKQTVRLSLPEFNAPNMRCETSAIWLADWYAVHIVSWNQSTPSSLSLRTEPKPPGPPDLREFPDALGSLSRVSGLPDVHTFALPSSDPVYSYALRVSKEWDPEDRCVFRVRSSIVQFASGDVVDELEIYAGIQPGECGE